MKMLCRMAVGMVAIGMGVFSAGVGSASDVYRIETTLRGSIQEGSFSNGVIRKVKIETDDFINLALHRPLGTTVPKQEVLAIASDCVTNHLRLIVYDKDTSSNLVTVGVMDTLRAIFSQRKNLVETITPLEILDISEGETNGITSGSFYYHGKINIKTNGCPSKFNGQWTGFLDTVFPATCTNLFCTNYIISCSVTNCVVTNCMPDCVTNCVTNCTTRVDCTTNIFPCVTRYTVIIPRSPISTGKSIGTVDSP